MDFCTYFDAHYLTRGLALYRSLAAHAGDFRLFVLALDEETESTLQRLHLPNVVLVGLAELEASHPELHALRGTRTRAGFYMTFTPLLLAQVFARDPSVQSLAYLDADLMFFANPRLAWDGSCAIGVIEHRCPAQADKSVLYGRFNVGLVAFRRDDESRRCLERWGQQCLEWCEPEPVNGLFGDQKYLDEWPSLYGGLTILTHPGANLAPWNVARHHLAVDHGGRVLVDGQPLVFFHFSCFKPLFWRFCYAGFGDSSRFISPLLRRHVLRPYAAALRRARREIGASVGAGRYTPGAIASVVRESLSFLRWRRLELL